MVNSSSKKRIKKFSKVTNFDQIQEFVSIYIQYSTPSFPPHNAFPEKKSLSPVHLLLDVQIHVRIHVHAFQPLPVLAQLAQLLHALRGEMRA